MVGRAATFCSKLNNSTITPTNCGTRQNAVCSRLRALLLVLLSPNYGRVFAHIMHSGISAERCANIKSINDFTLPLDANFCYICQRLTIHPSAAQIGHLEILCPHSSLTSVHTMSLYCTVLAQCTSITGGHYFVSYATR